LQLICCAGGSRSWWFFAEILAVCFIFLFAVAPSILVPEFFRNYIIINMKGKYVGIIVFLSVIVLLIASCNLFPPDLVLRVVNPSIASIGGGNVQISFELYNSGSEALQNCKVKWYVDNIDGDNSVIEYDEITVWAPGIGVDLGVYGTGGPFTVDTTSGNFSDGVNVFGVYEMGWDGSTDE